MQALLAGDTVAGVAGGVNAMMLPITMCTICGLSALSPQARCLTFDAAADGYGRGEAFAGRLPTLSLAAVYGMPSCQGARDQKLVLHPSMLLFTESCRVQG